MKRPRRRKTNRNWHFQYLWPSSCRAINLRSRRDSLEPPQVFWAHGSADELWYAHYSISIECVCLILGELWRARKSFLLVHIERLLIRNFVTKCLCVCNLHWIVHKLVELNASKPDKLHRLYLLPVTSIRLARSRCFEIYRRRMDLPSKQSTELHNQLVTD